MAPPLPPAVNPLAAGQEALEKLVSLFGRESLVEVVEFFESRRAGHEITPRGDTLSFPGLFKHSIACVDTPLRQEEGPWPRVEDNARAT